MMVWCCCRVLAQGASALAHRPGQMTGLSNEQAVCAVSQIPLCHMQQSPTHVVAQFRSYSASHCQSSSLTSSYGLAGVDVMPETILQTEYRSLADQTAALEAQAAAESADGDASSAPAQMEVDASRPGKAPWLAVELARMSHHWSAADTPGLQHASTIQRGQARAKHCLKSADLCVRYPQHSCVKQGGACSGIQEDWSPQQHELQNAAGEEPPTSELSQVQQTILSKVLDELMVASRPEVCSGAPYSVLLDPLNCAS